MRKPKSRAMRRRNILIRGYIALLSLILVLSLTALLSQTAFATTYVINDGDKVVTCTSFATDPAEVLGQAGVPLKEYDTYTTEAAEGGSTITVNRAQRITVHYRGKTMEVTSLGETVAQLLQRLGLELTGEDMVSHGLEEQTHDDEDDHGVGNALAEDGHCAVADLAEGVVHGIGSHAIRHGEGAALAEVVDDGAAGGLHGKGGDHGGHVSLGNDFHKAFGRHLVQFTIAFAGDGDSQRRHGKACFAGLRGRIERGSIRNNADHMSFSFDMSEYTESMQKYTEGLLLKYCNILFILFQKRLIA